MSSNGLQNTNLIINTIDGLTNIWATDIYENGQKLSIAGLVPYTGANQTIDLNNQIIRSTHTATNAADLINLSTLSNAIVYIDNANSLTYLNKIVSTSQSVLSVVNFDSGINTNSLSITGLSNINTILVSDSNKNVISSGVSVTTLSTFVTNSTLTSSLSNYLPLSGGTVGSLTVTNNLNIGSRLLGTPDNTPDGNFWIGLQGTSSETSRLGLAFIGNYVTGAISNLYISKTLDMGSNKITSSYTPVNGVDILNKTYGDSTYSTITGLSNLTTTVNSKLSITDAAATYSTITGLTNLTTTVNSKLSITDAAATYSTITGLSNLTTTVNSKLSITDAAATYSTITGLTNLTTTVNSKLSITDAAATYSTITGLSNLSNTVNSKLSITDAAATYSTITGLSNLSNTVNTKVSKTGDTMTGDLTLNSYYVNCSSDPSSDNQLTRKKYVDTLIASRIPRTGDTSLIGDYQTSGMITAAGLVSTGGIRGTAFLTGSAVIEYNRTSDRGKWFKIMNIGITTNVYHVEAHLTFSAAGEHGHIHFIISCLYNSSPSIKVVNSSFYGSVLIQQLRISTDNSDIYKQGFVEMFLGDYSWYEANINIYLYGINNTPLNSNYSLINTKTAGTTSGFTYNTVSTNAAFDYAWSGNRIFYNGSEMYLSGSIRPSNALVLNNVGDCRLYNGGIDTFNPTGANNLMIKSWWGIGYESYDGGVRIAMNTRDGAAYFAGNVGIGVTTPNAKLQISNGDNSKAYFGPNTTWNAYLFVGSGTTNINATTAQVISTNGNLHLDAGYGKDLYLQYYPNSVGQVGNTYSHGTWTHNGAKIINGTISTSTGANQNFLTLYANSNNSTEYINLRFSHQGNSTYIQSYRTSGFWRTYLIFNTVNASGGSVTMFQITDQGIQSYGSFYTAGNAWCGDATSLGNGCSLFSQGWDRWLCYANGYNTSGGYAYYNQANGLGTISDRRIKKDFQRITEQQSVAFIQALEPTSFCLKEQKPCKRKRINEKGEEIEEDVTPTVCSCRQDGWIAQNVLEACEVSGASKSVVNNWYDYQQELNKPEGEQKTLIGVSDRPILSHTVNVVKHLLDKNQQLEKEIESLKDIIYQHNELLKKISERLK